MTRLTCGSSNAFLSRGAICGQYWLSNTKQLRVTAVDDGSTGSCVVSERVRTITGIICNSTSVLNCRQSSKPDMSDMLTSRSMKSVLCCLAASSPAWPARFGGYLRRSSLANLVLATAKASGVSSIIKTFIICYPLLLMLLT